MQVTMRFLKAQMSFTRLCWQEFDGPPVTSQTQRVRMNLSPGNLPELLVCHFLSAGFFEFFPTMGFCTIASLK
jgi:hypothetical protein